MCTTTRRNYLLIALVSLSAHIACDAVEAQRVVFGTTLAAPVRPGWVGMVKLGLFADAALRPACDKLLERDLRGAEADFAAALKTSPDDPVAWLGLVQASPEFRKTEFSRLHGAKQVDRGTAFRKGVLELYDWGEHEFHGSALDAIHGVSPARQLLKAAWDEGRGEVLYGVLYTETWIVVPQLPAAPLRTTEQMMAKVLPPTVWADYRDRIASRRWSGDPPPASNTPRMARHLLVGVLGARRTFVTVRIQPYDLHNPANTPIRPLTRPSRMEADYLDRWLRLLKKAL